MIIVELPWNVKSLDEMEETARRHFKKGSTKGGGFWPFARQMRSAVPITSSVGSVSQMRANAVPNTFPVSSVSQRM